MSNINRRQPTFRMSTVNKHYESVVTMRANEFMPRPLSHEPLPNEAARIIKGAILSGQLRPGQRIIESKLADDFQTSRGTVREALRGLEVEGLVRRIPNKGIFVAELSRKDMEDIHVVRAVIEGLAMRLTCQLMNEERFATLEDIVRHSEVAYEARDYETLDELAIQFHANVCSWADNQQLVKQWRILQDRMRLCAVYLYSTKEPLPVERQVLTHRDCLEALRTGNPENAETIMRRHIDCSREGALIMWDKFYSQVARDNQD